MRFLGVVTVNGRIVDGTYSWETSKGRWDMVYLRKHQSLAYAAFWRAWKGGAK